jgi:XTP/dITP diphosphohydrolase
VALTLVIASANPHKAAELRELLEAVLGGAITLVDRPIEIPDIEETGVTLEENARMKAVAIAAATGLAAIADDTGLEVAALGGAPGVFSARYAGEDATYDDNVAKLLAELKGSSDRSARFRTVCLVAFPDGKELIAEGVATGTIAAHPVGTTGFGYDPVFLPDADPTRTYAELDGVEKNRLSHRGAAVRAIGDLLADHLTRQQDR